MREKITTEEKIIYDTIISARKIQQYLWGRCNSKWGILEWAKMFKKRIVKIDDIDINNPHAIIELKKRLLQNSALCVALLALIEKSEAVKILQDDTNQNIPSNLPQYNIEKRSILNET